MAEVLPLLFLLSANPEAVGRLKETAAAEEQQDKLSQSYVFQERQTNWSLEKNGERKAEPWAVRVYEHIFLEGALYRQLVERNGKPLNEKEMQKRDEAPEGSHQAPVGTTRAELLAGHAQRPDRADRGAGTSLPADGGGRRSDRGPALLAGGGGPERR